MADPRNPHTLETVTGKFLDLLHPDPNDICITDIAWSLSRLARYNGHTIQTIPYSVGQHSLFVEELLPEDVSDILRLQALLHDAGEAYTGDISGPLKKIPELRPIIKKIEHNIDVAIFTALDVPIPTPEEYDRIIKHSDNVAQRIEAYNFMVSRGMNWTNMPDVSIEELQNFELPLPSLEVYHKFLSRFDELKYFQNLS